jgi:hypothetical protein
MFPLTSSQLSKFAAVGAVFALTAFTPMGAEDLPQNLGPVGPNDPILTDVGTKRVLAWYKAEGGGCAINVVVWNRTDIEGTSTSGVRIRLNPGQMIHIDSAYNVKSLNLKCSADDVANLSIVDNEELVAFDIERTKLPTRASASGY